jgi:Domain of unknown function (DUF1990)
MSRQLALSRRLVTAARWPLGVSLTSWRYMWRTTPMRRREVKGSREQDSPPSLPPWLSTDETQPPEDGVGALYHRTYAVLIRHPQLSPEELVSRLAADPDRAAPSEFASFNKVRGEDGEMNAGDEYVVRMPGPWDGPVRVAEVTPTSFRFVTLDRHLEAGQIEFRAARRADDLLFTIESWARSGDRLSNLLYGRLRMAKEVQLHMWTSFLERVVELSGGSRTGLLEIATRRVDDEVDGDA